MLSFFFNKGQLMTPFFHIILKLNSKPLLFWTHPFQWTSKLLRTSSVHIMTVGSVVFLLHYYIYKFIRLLMLYCYFFFFNKTAHASLSPQSSYPLMRDITTVLTEHSNTDVTITTDSNGVQWCNWVLEHWLRILKKTFQKTYFLKAYLAKWFYLFAFNQMYS